MSSPGKKVRKSRSLSKAKRDQLKRKIDALVKEQGATSWDGDDGDDEVNHPSHYTSHPSGVECVEITEHFNFNIGNAVKYLWRAGLKHPNPKTDLEKALWYVNRELERLDRQHNKPK